MSRSLFHLFLSFNMAFIAPATLYADDPMSQAQEAVRASMIQASARASEAISLDFNFAMSDVMQNLTNNPNWSELSAGLVSRQSALYEGLVEFSQLDADEIASLQSQAQLAYDNYKTLIRERFDLSFGFAEVRAHRRDILNLVVSSLRKFQSNCKTGRGVGGLDEVAFSYPDLPEPMWSVNVGTENGNLTSIDGGYSGSGSEREKKRNEISGAFLQGASYTATFAFAGEGGIVANACMTAMPWAVGGAVVVAAVVAYVNHSERIKQQNKIVEAKSYAFTNMATDKDVARYYREQCTSASEQLNPIIRVFETAIASPETLHEMATGDFDLASFQALVKERDAIRSRIQAIINDPAFAKELEALIKQVIQIEQQISEAATPTHIAQMAIQVLLKQNQELIDQVREFSQQKLDLAQEIAFRKVLKILRLLQNKKFAKYTNDTDLISADLAALGEYIEARSLFKKVLVAQIQHLFERVSKEKVTEVESQLRTTTLRLVRRHAANREVQLFAQQVIHLIGDL